MADFLFTLSARLDGAVSSSFAQFEQQGQRAAASVERGVSRLNRETSVTADRFRTAAAAAGVFQGALGGVASRLNSSALLFESAGAGIAATLGLIAGAAATLGALSGIQNYQARLKAATKSEAEFGAAQALTFRIAKDSRSGLNDTIAFYTRLSAGTKELGLSQKALGSIITTVQKSIQLSGAGAQEAAAAQTQFIQGLTSANGLSGDEFKSLGENAVVVLQAIADGLKRTNAIPGFDGSISALRQLGAEGKLTARTLAPAMLAIESSIAAAFDRMPVTIEQATTLVKTSLTQLVISAENATGFLGKSANAIASLADNLRGVGAVATVAGGVLLARFAGPLVASGVAAIGLRANLLATALGTSSLVIQTRAAGAGASALAIQEAALGRVMAAANIPLAEQTALLLRNRAAVASGATSLGGLSAAMVATRGAVTGLRGAASGLLSVFGGPWGLAITAAAAAVYLLATRENEAERSARLFGGTQEALAIVVRETTDAVLKQVNRVDALKRSYDALDVAAAKIDDPNVAEAKTGVQGTRRRLSYALDSASRNGQLRNPSAIAAGKALSSDIASGVVGYDQIITRLNTVARLEGQLSPRLAGSLRDLRNLYTGSVLALDQVTGRRKDDAVATAANEVAVNSLTRAQLNANAAVRAISSATSPLVAAKRREQKALADLDAEYAKQKTHTDGEQTAYSEQRATIVSAYDQQVAAVRDGEKAKTDARRAGLKAQRDATRDARRDIDAELAAAKAAQAEFGRIAYRYDEAPTRRKQVARDRSDALFSFLHGGTDKAGFDKLSGDLDTFLVKPLTDVNIAAREQFNIQTLISEGREADAEVLRLALNLIHTGADASQINLRSIADQVEAEAQLNVLTERRNQLLEIQARTAGEVQAALRDALRGFQDGKIGDSLKNLGKSLQNGFKDQIADRLSIQLFGDAEGDARREQVGALKTTTEGLYAVRDALNDYQSAIGGGIGGIGSIGGGGGGSAGIDGLGAVFGSSIADGLSSSFDSLLSSPLVGRDNSGGTATDAGGTIASGVVPGFAGSGLGLIANLTATTATGIGKLPGAVGKSSRDSIFSASNATRDNFNKIGGDLGGKLDEVFGTDGALGKLGGQLGSALQGIGYGQQASGALGSLGIKQSKTGATIGAAAGTAFFGPLGGAIGGAIGGTIGGLLKKTPQGSFSLSSGSGGAATGNSSSAIKAAGEFGTGIQSALTQLASQFGTTVGSFQALTVGIRHGDYRVNTTGTSLKNAKGATDFDDDAAAALAFALKEAINRGALEGLRDGTRRLLTAVGDIDAQAAKAVKFEGVFTDLKSILDPTGAAVDALDTRFRGLAAVFAEAGASADDYAKLQQLYDLQRVDALKAAEGGLLASLKSYLTGLTTSEGSGLSVRDRRATALEGFNPFAADIGAGKKVDVEAYTAAADLLLASDRELYGSTQAYFERLAQITELTRKAIADQTNVTSIAAALDFKAAIDPVTAGLTALQAALLAQGYEGNNLLVEIAGKLSGASGGNASANGQLGLANRY